MPQRPPGDSLRKPRLLIRLGVPLIQANTDYTVRARCARNSTLNTGTLHVHLFSAGVGINTTGLQLTSAQLTTSYVEYTAALTAPLTSIPSDLQLRIFADGTPNLNRPVST